MTEYQPWEKKLKAILINTEEGDRLEHSARRLEDQAGLAITAGLLGCIAAGAYGLISELSGHRDAATALAVLAAASLMIGAVLAAARGRRADELHRLARTRWQESSAQIPAALASGFAQEQALSQPPPPPGEN